MSKDIRVQWYRGGFASNHRQSQDVIPVQVDNMSMQEAAYYGGTEPYFRYYAFVNTTQYAFLYQDGLQDVSNIDPKTSTFTRYRIINDAEPFPDNHYELVLDRMIGT